MIGQCTIEGRWRCLHWLLKANHVVQNHRRHCDALFGLQKTRRCVGLIDFFLGRSKHIQRKAHAFRGRPTLKDVERQLRNGSFRELNETEMYPNVTEMDANIESDISKNTNYLISSAYFEDGSDKENNSTNNIDAISESSEDKVKTLAKRTNGLTLVPFTRRTNSLPLSVPSTTKVSFCLLRIFVFLLLNSLFLCNGLIAIVQLAVLAIVFIAILCI